MHVMLLCIEINTQVLTMNLTLWSYVCVNYHWSAIVHKSASAMCMNYSFKLLRRFLTSALHLDIIFFSAFSPFEKNNVLYLSLGFCLDEYQT